MTLLAPVVREIVGCVLDDRRSDTDGTTSGQLGDVISPLDVHRIGHTGMVGGEFQSRSLHPTIIHLGP